MKLRVLNRQLAISCAAALAFSLSTTAMAAEDPAGSEWTFTAAPYVWFTSVDGEVATIGGLPPADVDASFGDLWDNLDFVAMGYFEGRRDRWGFGADLIYMDLGADGDGPVPAFSKTEMDFKAFIGTFAPFYRAVEEETFTLDVSAGARVWVTDTEITLKSDTVPNRSNSEKETWIDPIIGMRVVFAATDKVNVNSYFDVGGFGVGSDITYQFFSTVSYEFTDSISAAVGYRYLKVDYENDDYVLNAEYQGPIVGLVVRF